MHSGLAGTLDNYRSPPPTPCDRRSPTYDRSVSPDNGAAENPSDAAEMPASFEDLSRLTFSQALEVFDDRYAEHTAYEEDRVRQQSEPEWAQKVLAKRASHACGVKFSEDALSDPSEPYPAAPYSRKWEVEHDLLETKNCIRTSADLIERFRAGTANYRHHFGDRCSLEQAVAAEEDCIEKWSKDAKPLEWELNWLNSRTAFDFTGESCQSDPEAIFGLEENGKALNFQIDVEQGSRSEWPALTKEQLAFLRKLDRAIYDAGDAVIPEYIDDGSSNPLLEWLVDQVGSASRLELLAAGRELAKRDPRFWPRLRDIGPTPGLLREANHILHGSVQQEGPHRKTAASGNPALLFLPRPRARTSRRPSSRVRGSRRVTTRSSASSGGGDPPGGSDDPEAEEPRRPLNGVGARIQWDVTMTGFGMTIGNGAMGFRGMLIGGLVGYLWARRRWREES